MNEWIPIKEQLPPVYEKVLMTTHEIGWNGEEYDQVVCRSYTGQTNITAWMPLPKPYKEKEK